jgi:hypothetical protein
MQAQIRIYTINKGELDNFIKHFKEEPSRSMTLQHPPGIERSPYGSDIHVMLTSLDGAWPAFIKNGGNSDDAWKTLIHDHRRRGGGGFRIGRRFGLGG